MDEDAKAEPLLQRALKSHVEVLGPENPHTATTFGDLAAVYHGMGDTPRPSRFSSAL